MFTSSVTSIRKYTMSLLDKIDILITPNAYKKGKLFAALPSPTFGGELAVDGDFADGSTAWTLNPGWSIGGNSARYDGNALGTSISQNISGVTGGNRYTVTFEVTQNTGDQNNTVSLGSTTLTNSTHLPLGCNTFTGVAGFGTALNIYGNSGELLIIRNLTVKQELTGIADLDFTRASAATRVDPLGFINYAGVLPGVEQVTNGNFQQIGPEEVSNGDFDQIGPEEVSNGDFDEIGPEEVSNGNFDQIGPEEVSNGDFSEEGSELVVNGDFNTDLSNWQGDGVYDNGRARVDVVGGAFVYMLQNPSFVNGKIYKLTFNVIGTNGKSIRTQDNSGNTGGLTSGNGTWNLNGTIQQFEVIWTANSNSNNLIFARSTTTGDWSFSIDNVSLKEVGQDWTIEDVWTIGNSVANGNGANGSSQQLVQSSVTTIGKTYKVTYDIINYVSGSVFMPNVGSIQSANGSYTEYITATQTDLKVTGINFNGSITNISVKEVGQDWTFGDGWGMGDGIATSDGTESVSYLRQNGIVNLTSIYKVQFTVSGSSSGTLNFLKGNASVVVNVTSNDTYTFYTAWDGLTGDVVFQSLNFVGSVDNVSVKEVGQDWSFGDGWGMGDGIATCDGTQSSGSYLLQNLVLPTPNQYLITFEVSNYASGNVKFGFSSSTSSPFGTVRTANGVYTETFTHDSNTIALRFRASDDFVGDIDNVSVKEVGQDWTVADSDADNYVVFDGSTARLKFLNTSPVTTFKTTDAILTGGKTYKLTVDIAVATSGGVKIDGNGISETFNTIGVNTRIITPTVNTSVQFYRATSNVDLTFNSVSVKEVFQGWTIGAGAEAPELSLGSVTFTSNGQNLFQPWTEETGTTYYIQLEGTGSVRLRTGFTGIPGQKIYVTLPDIITVNTDADTNRIQIYGSSSGTAVLTNVSVVEGGEIDIPRIDYTGGGCPHILVEPERTNLITYSEDFSQSYWTKARTTVEPGFISPDGTENAYKLIENTAENVHAFYNSTFGVNNGDTYTISLFIKYNGRQWFRLWGQFGSSNKEAYFDIENGLLGQKDSGLTSKIEDYGNDWYRISASATSDGTIGRFRGYLAEADGDSFYQGDGTSGAFIWGAQFEQGSYATSYIPTEGTTATRAIETYESAEDISSLINDSEGVLFSEVYFEQTGLTNGLFAISDGTFNNILMVRYSPINKLQIESTGGVNIIESSARPSGTYKIAVKYDSNGVELWVDGNKILETSTQSTMSGINELMLGKSPYGNIVGCKVKQLQVYGTALTDEELTLLTIPPNSTYSTYAEMANALNYTLQ